MPQTDTDTPAAGARDLAEIRAEIDRIDDTLLELIERRLSHVLAVAEVKRSVAATALLLRPDREEAVLNRLADRAAALRHDTIAVLWRELMGVSLQAQRRTELVLHAARQPIRVTDATRQRFGCAAPIVIATEAHEALEAARSREAIAVIELDAQSRWWAELFQDPDLVIFDRVMAGEETLALTIGRLTGDSLPGGVTYPIVSDVTLQQRTIAGEDIRPLAACGHLRLCIARETRA
jgi:chorismate mutase